WAGEVGRYLKAESERQLLIVNNASVSLNCSLSKSTITLGEAVEIEASLQVATNEGNITIQYNVNGAGWLDLVKGSPVNGTFKYVWSPEEPGEYLVRALWSGGKNYAPATSQAEALTVVKP
ncbi:TPA: Ig-like domain repeat protein, partial [Candidatus Bathyarchaeota archaeon]|nr:Ig-like domain repeat protein [Candidatus Bathyarchaeota archaeon]